MSENSCIDLETSSHVLQLFPSPDGNHYYALADKADRTAYAPIPLTAQSELVMDPIPSQDGEGHVLQVKLADQNIGEISSATEDLDQLAEFTGQWNRALQELRDNEYVDVSKEDSKFNPISLATKLFTNTPSETRPRSSTVGSTHAPNPVEAIAPKIHARRDEFLVEKHYTLKLATWNVHGESVQRVNLAALLGMPKKHDLYVICLQESDPLGPKNLTANGDTLKSTQNAIISTLGGPRSYKLVSSNQLLGIMILLVASAELEPHFSNIRTETTGTGLFGIWGNKGAASIKVTLGADDHVGIAGTELIFVGCHLAAGEGKPILDRRKSELGEIERRMSVPGLLNTAAPEVMFTDGIEDGDADDLPPSPEVTASMSFVLGDLNYRVQLEPGIVEDFVRGKEYDTILTHDTLSQQIQERKIFTGLKEQSIDFPPTFKYAIGTDSFDQSRQGSDKAKTPSYTDRIFYSPSPSLTPKEYTSIMDYSLSDHKPVTALFDFTVSVVDPEKRKQVVESILKQSDSIENSSRPTITVSPKELIVNDAKVLEDAHGEIVISQASLTSGSSTFPVEWELTLDSPSITASPTSGVLPAGAKVYIRFHCELPIKPDTITAVAVLRVKEVQDIFIPVEFHSLPTCLGKSLSFLARTPLGARSGVTVTGDEDGATNMPREIWNCVNYLWSHAFADMFDPKLSRPEKSIQLQVQEWMDEGKDFDYEVLDTANKLKRNSAVYSVAQQLVVLLQNLEGGIVMPEYYPVVLRGRDGAVIVSIFGNRWASTNLLDHGKNASRER